MSLVHDGDIAMLRKTFLVLLFVICLSMVIAQEATNATAAPTTATASGTTSATPATTPSAASRSAYLSVAAFLASAMALGLGLQARDGVY